MVLVFFIDSFFKRHFKIFLPTLLLLEESLVLRAAFHTELKEKSETYGPTMCVCPYGKLQTNTSAFHSGKERGVNVSETGQEVNAYNMSRTGFFQDGKNAPWCMNKLNV